MRNKWKMQLLDEYVSLYRVLYICRQRIFMANTSIENLQSLCEKANLLKKEFDNTFEILGMNNPSLLVFKDQLNKTLYQNTQKNLNNHDANKLLNKLNEIQKNKDKILNKFNTKKLQIKN